MEETKQMMAPPGSGECPLVEPEPLPSGFQGAGPNGAPGAFNPLDPENIEYEDP